MNTGREKRRIFYIYLIFITLTVTYFMPAAKLEEVLPESVVKFRIAYPVAVLALMGAYLGIGWKFVAALLFSCTGDAMGAYGSFFGQMGYFAAAHIMLIWAFAERLRKMRKASEGEASRRKQGRNSGCTENDFWNSRTWQILVILTIVSVLAFAFILVIPRIPEVALQIGCGIYAVLIATMFGLALMQRSPLFAVGAALFLISDMILSWSRFVGPIIAGQWLVMMPYYLGQLLIWSGAVGSMKNWNGAGDEAREKTR